MISLIPFSKKTRMRKLRNAGTANGYRPETSKTKQIMAPTTSIKVASVFMDTETVFFFTGNLLI
jgi:hypothetical protein